MRKSPEQRFVRCADITQSAACVLAACALLASCATAPPPPTVDESTRRPVNSRATLELQACKAELSKAQAALSEAQLFARARAFAEAERQANLAAQPPADAKAQACAAAAQEPAANQTYIIPFDNNSSKLALTPKDADALALQASRAAHIVIRGRTDAVRESLHDASLARRRADAAASFLIDRGTPASRLRVTWQAFGDGLVSSAAQNRRVELEFYAVKPVSTLLLHDASTKQ